ncbi:hypothetical protein C8J57DRAFT_1245572 [Mycena rebaudengoi]|nr:hypothetical protein C8J57DRAFT_1245572 [Mycena rebaudengoi]
MVLSTHDENRVFVADPQAPAPFNISSRCANYWDVQTNVIPGPLANVTGVFKRNVWICLPVYSSTRPGARSRLRQLVQQTPREITVRHETRKPDVRAAAVASILISQNMLKSLKNYVSEQLMKAAIDALKEAPGIPWRSKGVCLDADTSVISTNDFTALVADETMTSVVAAPGKSPRILWTAPFILDLMDGASVCARTPGISGNIPGRCWLQMRSRLTKEESGLRPG